MDFSLLCDPGFTCPAGSVHPRVNICAKGYKCPQSTTDPIACVDPTEYQDRMGAIACNTCQPGYWCDQTTTTRCEP